MLTLMDIISCSGHVAEGSLNFTSLEPTTLEPARGTNVSGSEALELHDNNSAQFANLDDDASDDEVRILQQSEPRCVAAMGSNRPRPAATRSGKEPAATSSGKEPAVSRSRKELNATNGGVKVGKRQNQENITGMLKNYMEMKAKQIEEEAAEKAKTVAEEADYSIKNCISIVNSIEELSSEKKAEAFDVFKDAQNRQIFMTAEPVARLIWLRNKMVWLLTYIGSVLVISNDICS